MHYSSALIKAYPVKTKAIVVQCAANIEPVAILEVAFIEKGLKRLHEVQDTVAAYMLLIDKHRKKKLNFILRKGSVINLYDFEMAMYGKYSRSYFTKLKRVAHKIEHSVVALENCFNQCEKYMNEYLFRKDNNLSHTMEISFQYIRAKYFRECYEQFYQKYQRALVALYRHKIFLLTPKPVSTTNEFSILKPKLM